MNLLISNNERTISLALSGTKANDRKMSALSQACATGIVAISHGRGTVAREAQAMKRDDEMQGVAVAVGSGNFHVFAVAYSARTGQNIKFGCRDDNGKWVRKPSSDFREFGATLRHALLQLEAKDKVYNAKGGFTAAAADLSYLIGLHTKACEVMDRIAEAEAAKTAKLTAEIAAEMARIDTEVLELQAAE